jgi:hypothetical protein
VTNDRRIVTAGTAHPGVGLSNIAGTVTNLGTIENTGGSAGVHLSAGGVVTNGASGSAAALIAGGTGVLLDGGGTARITNFGTLKGTIGIAVAAGAVAGTTLTNSGRIIGTGGTAVAFGGGNDVLTVDAGAVFAGMVNGGGGADEIVQGAAGTLAVAGFTGFETIVLFNGGIDKLTLKSTNFTGVTGATITVTGGGKGDTVSAAGVAAADRIIVHAGAGPDFLVGGAGNDAFYAGGRTMMTGGAGANEFVFAATGSNMVEDFAKSPANELVFSNAGFNLRLGGSATPKRLTTAQAAKLFVANTTGNFTKASQRLAYDTSTGQLFSGTHGSAGSEQLVATLSDHAMITAGQLFFIS